MLKCINLILSTDKPARIQKFLEMLLRKIRNSSIPLPKTSFSKATHSKITQDKKTHTHFPTTKLLHEWSVKQPNPELYGI